MNKENIINIAKIAIDAGIAILEVYNFADFGVEIKKDNSPLTIADSKSNEVILKCLNELTIDGGILPLLSEEGKEVPYEERINWGKYWLIDPLDGTKEFIKKNGEFTVNIALIEDGIPTAGFVYIPVKDILFFGSKENGSFKMTEASVKINSNIFDISEKLSVSDNLPDTIKVVASRSHLSTETEEYINKLETKYQNVETVSSGS
ncbi:MAG: 3'(2'),5'-bisphosphate nucleotidase CysQ, partial [Spirochaetales bacterium]|nr:3'(2'),5'-bisphosphate nucleotidase CysQ [Spirochaetales bacterium]